MSSYNIKISKTNISDIVSRHDPVGLLAIGAPTNEYAPEVDDLYDTICKNKMEDLLLPGALEKAVRQIFAAKFGQSIVDKCLPAYEAIANDLLPLLSEREHE
jgi:hypothetical protein